MPRKKIKAKVLRNLVTATINGLITLAILLIAPLGLAAVITNTILVAIASFFSGSLTEIVMELLSSPEINVDVLPEERQSKTSTSIEPRRGSESLRRDDR
ncbi:CRISPR-associated protein Csx18 [Synechococcus sp. H55.7]|uniref:CRISPR-associated protein Csx18 n=1 Tax=unclassified Synechococcus TaxID=2626047 RepID=UPI0039C339A7